MASKCDYIDYQILALKKINELIDKLGTSATNPNTVHTKSARPTIIEIDLIDANDYSGTVDAQIVFHYGGGKNDAIFDIMFRVLDCERIDIVNIKMAKTRKTATSYEI